MGKTTEIDCAKNIDACYRCLDSPIEKAFLSAFGDFLSHDPGRPFPLFIGMWLPEPMPLESIGVVASRGWLPILRARDTELVGALFLQPTIQLRTGNIRCDFVLHREGTSPIAIELDGHDFHERTKEQAIRDRSRDRDLQREGWLVARFTGREVHRDPMECVQEVFRIVVGNWHANGLVETKPIPERT